MSANCILWALYIQKGSLCQPEAQNVKYSTHLEHVSMVNVSEKTLKIWQNILNILNNFSVLLMEKGFKNEIKYFAIITKKLELTIKPHLKWESASGEKKSNLLQLQNHFLNILKQDFYCPRRFKHITH